jgi:ATP-dependent Clp protease ATP-binding subunit ClpA
LKTKKITATITLSLKTYLANTGYDKDFWARPLKRLITKKLINPISSKLISWEIEAWDSLELDLWEDKEVVVNC